MDNLTEKIHFHTYEEIYPYARKLFDVQAGKLLNYFPDIEIEHVGGSSIPGAITLGDLDIQLRVSQVSFPAVVEGLKAMYHENHPQLWTDQFAIFHKKENPAMPISLVVTVKGSKYDTFSRFRDLLKNDFTILERYNALKREYEGRTLGEYKEAKQYFLGPNGADNFVREV